MDDSINFDKTLHFSDAFSLNRTGNLENVETGTSLGHGIDYILSKSKTFKSENAYTLKTGISQIIADKRQNNMPNKSSLNNKSSDYAGYFNYNFYEDKNNFNYSDYEKEKISFLNIFEKNKVSLGYNYNLNNDFSEINRNSFDISSVYKTFFGSIKFEEKKYHIGNEKYAELEIKKLFTNNIYFNLETKKNLNTNASEYHKFSLNFENDCLITSLSFTKDFYYDEDVKNSKKLIFGVIIKPFSDNIAPDLTSFIE